LIAWLVTRALDDQAQAVLTGLAGGAAFFGHLFPVWLGFKGGKGVATFFGTLLAAAWPVGLLAGATWLLMAAVFRVSSLAALTAAVLAPIYVLVLHRPHPIAVLAAVMAVLIFIRHEANIRRLLKGEEPKIGGKTKANPAEEEGA
jgi:glycerol-3-phosphate acyltransferase PlsY